MDENPYKSPLAQPERQATGTTGWPVFHVAILGVLALAWWTSMVFGYLPGMLYMASVSFAPFVLRALKRRGDP